MILFKNKNKIKREGEGKRNFTATGEKKEWSQRQIRNKDLCSQSTKALETAP